MCKVVWAGGSTETSNIKSTECHETSSSVMIEDAGMDCWSDSEVADWD